MQKLALVLSTALGILGSDVAMSQTYRIAEWFDAAAPGPPALQVGPYDWGVWAGCPGVGCGVAWSWGPTAAPGGIPGFYSATPEQPGSSFQAFLASTGASVLVRGAGRYQGGSVGTARIVAPTPPITGAVQQFSIRARNTASAAGCEAVVSAGNMSVELPPGRSEWIRGSIVGQPGNNRVVVSVSPKSSAGFLCPDAIVAIDVVVRAGVEPIPGPPVGVNLGQGSTHPTSTGASATLYGFGSAAVLANDLTFESDDLPAMSFGYLLASQSATDMPIGGSSQGRLLVGPPVTRFLGQIQQADATGFMSLQIDVTQPMLGGQPVGPGETWYYQYWFRDANPSVTSNTTSAVQVTFE